MEFAGLLIGGAIVGVLILDRSLSRARDHRFLRVLLGCLVIGMAAEWCAHAGLVERWPHLLWLSTPINYLFGPLLLLWQYERRSGRRLRGVQIAPHLLVFAAVVVSLGPTYGLDASTKQVLFQHWDPLPADGRLQIVHLAIYLGAVLVQWARTASSEPAAGVELPTRWERIVVAVVSLCILLAVPRLFASVAWPSWLTAYGVAISLLVASQIALRSGRPRTVVPSGLSAEALLPSPSPPLNSLSPSPSSSPPLSSPSPSPLPSSPSPRPLPSSSSPRPSLVADGRESAGSSRGGEGKYDRSGLGPIDAQRLAQRVEDLMQQQRPYLDRGLDQAGLAALLGIRAEWLSQVLNERLGQSFPRYVNRYRVEAAKRTLLGLRGEPHTLRIAHDVGFGSKSTFYRAFKADTGMTPRQFWMEHRHAAATSEREPPSSIDPVGP